MCGRGRGGNTTIPKEEMSSLILSANIGASLIRLAFSIATNKTSKDPGSQVVYV